MEKMGVISKVGEEAIEWCHPLVVVPKPNGEVILCVDKKKLNDQVYGPIHPMRTPRDVLSLPTKCSFRYILLAIN
uniref:Putative LOC101859799 [Aplysia californica] n=1 Tax=Lepeophtheirus salmonis TaxID=72036 RepID=A0A0K2VDR7_LEPSM